MFNLKKYVFLLVRPKPHARQLLLSCIRDQLVPMRLWPYIIEVFLSLLIFLAYLFKSWGGGRRGRVFRRLNPLPLRPPLTPVRPPRSPPAKMPRHPNTAEPLHLGGPGEEFKSDHRKAAPFINQHHPASCVPCPEVSSDSREARERFKGEPCAKRTSSQHHSLCLDHTSQKCILLIRRYKWDRHIHNRTIAHLSHKSH